MAFFRLPVPLLVMVSTRVLSGWPQTLSADHNVFFFLVSLRFGFFISVVTRHDLSRCRKITHRRKRRSITTRLVQVQVYIVSRFISLLITLSARSRSSCRF